MVTSDHILDNFVQCMAFDKGLARYMVNDEHITHPYVDFHLHMAAHHVIQREDLLHYPSMIRHSVEALQQFVAFTPATHRALLKSYGEKVFQISWGPPIVERMSSGGAEY